MTDVTVRPSRLSRELEYTPGPWTHDWNGYFYDIKPGGSVFDLASINSAWTPDLLSGTQRANAQLVSAAPELFEALVWAMRFVEQVRAENPAPKGGGEDIKYNQALEAIAKVRERDPRESEEGKSWPKEWELAL